MIVSKGDISQTQLVSNATRTGTAVRLSKSTDLICATPANADHYRTNRAKE